ncbi:Helicase required for RNAi-mediated heterochromatin assembly 1, partial [Pseudolycoriella hygida]
IIHPHKRNQTVLLMMEWTTSSGKNDNMIVPEEIKVEPELVLLDDDEESNEYSAEYDGQGVMSICQTEYEEYEEHEAYNGSEVVANTGTYMSYDEIQLQNDLETSQNAVDEDVILIESDSDENEAVSSDMKVLYECHLCFKTVATSYNLKRHMMIHSGERPYCCDICGNKRAYICNVCDRIFGSSHNLKRHHMIHTGEKPYKCDWSGCPKYFRELSTLRKHRGTHSKALEYTAYTKQQLFECQVCRMKFMSYDNLSEHMESNQHYASVENLSEILQQIIINMLYGEMCGAELPLEELYLTEEYGCVTKTLAIDCEMVAVGPYKLRVLGRVSIVNENGFCIYDTYVTPRQEITDYCTEYSGIRPENLANAPKFDVVAQEVACIVKDRLLVSHSIDKNLEVLELHHPAADIRDTAIFFRNRGKPKRPPELKSLAKIYLDKNIQTGEHSSIQDAQATLALYLLFQETWENNLSIRRTEANLNLATRNATDISCMQVEPRQLDLQVKSNSVFVRRNKLLGAYYSCEEYKDIQFRLLMEDFLRPLREELLMARNGETLSNRFVDIQIASEDMFNCAFEVKDAMTLLVPIAKNKLEKVDTNGRNFLLQGSILIISPDNFNSIKLAKVVDVQHDKLRSNAPLKVSVNFLLHGSTWTVTSSNLFQMIESKTYFKPYELVLDFLQEIDLNTFPMKKYIVDAVTKSDVVPHLLQDSTNKIDFSALMNSATTTRDVCAYPLEYENWPDASTLNLNASQYEALQNAVTQELTIIQGPPGTGKSYIALQIVKLLLTNEWLCSSPILIVSHTNHALDELLEPILHFMTEYMYGGNETEAQQSLLRIGGGCQSEKILPSTFSFKLDNTAPIVFALDRVKNLDFDDRFIHQGIFNFLSVPKILLQELETNEAIQQIFESWKKSYDEIRSDALSWFGLNDQQIKVRDVQPSAFFFVLTKNLNSILEDKWQDIPVTLEELKERSLYNEDIDQQYLTRWGYYFFLIDELAKIVCSTRNKYKFANNEILTGANIKQRAKVVAMTTTGAVKYKYDVENVFQPKIMIVEEAAHVLEAHVVASLTKHCTQLILIGDHKQLRPMIADHTLRRKNLDVSLMERLVNNGIAQKVKNFTQLKTQHRMRPEIAELICPLFYDELKSDANVESYPNVKGCAKNVFFVHHTNPESKNSYSNGRSNLCEAEYIVKWLHHFTASGYLPSQITVICAYSAQKTLIENVYKINRAIEGNASIGQIEISTIDGYQGKQNDLIILSLVRNNDKDNVGFLKTDNRVCVALSRARHGLIMVGNMNLLANSSTIWSKIIGILRERHCIGTELPLTYDQLNFINIKANKLTDAPRYAVYCNNLSGLIKYVLEQRQVTQFHLKIGIDSGGGSLKVSLSIQSTEEDELAMDRSKRQSYDDSIASKRFRDSGVKKLFIIGIAETVQENYQNVSLLWSEIDINISSGNGTFVIDLKLANIICGLMPHSSLFPCTFCISSKYKLSECAEFRTIRNSLQSNEKWLASGAKKNDAKMFFNCIQMPLFTGASNLDERFIDIIPPPELHLMLGVVNTIYDHIHGAFNNEALAWAKSCNVEKSVTQAGTGFNGNARKKLLEKLDILRAICPVGCLKFVKALEDFHSVVKSCFGQNLDPNFEKNLNDFKRSFLDLNVSVTPKIHAVFYHVGDFCRKHQKSLGFYSEQSMEPVHFEFKSFWSKYKMNVNHPEYSNSLLRAVREFNALHV